MEEQKLFATNKLVAMHWLTQGYVLCNEIADLDDTIWDSLRKSTLDAEEDDDSLPEIFQYFLTSLSTDDVEWMCEHFTDMVFGYSSMLDVWVFMATDFGTHRSYVTVYTDIPAAARKDGEPLDLPFAKDTRVHVEALLNYLRFDWCKEEFDKLFPDDKWQYLWERYLRYVESDKDKAFANWYNSLDWENRTVIIDRINDTRVN